MMEKSTKRLIVLSSPSGGGKSTVARYLLKIYPELKFSVSATTRKKRPHETEGKDYFYLAREEFERKIQLGELVEYEEIFDNYYGTLKSFIDDAINNNQTLLFDVDVKGALSLRKHYPEETLLVFLKPPNENILKERLSRRKTEDDAEIEKRLSRAKMEMSQQDKFDYVIINDNLTDTYKHIEEIAFRHIDSPIGKK